MAPWLNNSITQLSHWKIRVMFVYQLGPAYLALHNSEMVLLGMHTKPVPVWVGQIWLGMVRFDLVCYILEWFWWVLFGVVEFCLVWFFFALEDDLNECRQITTKGSSRLGLMHKLRHAIFAWCRPPTSPKWCIVIIWITPTGPPPHMT